MTFVGSTPYSTDNEALSYVSSRNMSPIVHTPYWSFKDDSELELKFQVDNTDDVMLAIRGEFAGSAPEDECVNRMSVIVNGTAIIESEFQSPTDSDLIVSIPRSNLKGSNTVKICYSNLLGGSYNSVDLLEVRLDYFPFNYKNKEWMAGIRDYTKLCDISIPGSHDAASIRKSCVRSVYSCQDRTITEQLEGGIRLFDIRIKVVQLNKTGFVTCHGDIGSSTGLNEYQSLKSVFDEFKSYLSRYSTEVVIASLKIDDWGVCRTSYDKARALGYLKDFLEDYKVYKNSNMPYMKDVRGFIYLINRITNSLDFGVPVAINEPYTGNYLPDTDNRNFKVYVQDKWNIRGFSPTEDKASLVWDTLSKKSHNDGVMYLNFASANYYLMGVYVMGELLARFGTNTKPTGRPWILGWILFDYGFWKVETDTYDFIDIISFIIDANFGYDKYGEKFKVIDREL